MSTEHPTYCFVLGTGRCGSSLVQEVLARHPDVGFISNLEDNIPQLQFMSRWNNLIYRTIPQRFTQKGRLRYAPSEGYRILDRHVSPILSVAVRDLVAADATPWLMQRCQAFFESRARAQGAAVFLHKFTGWPRAGFIERVLPGTKFVHIIRDGRAFANSALQSPWWRGYGGPPQWQWGPLPAAYAAEWEASGRSFVLLAGLLWKLLIDAFEAAEHTVATDSWLTVRYEDIVADPGRRFAELLQFIGLEWRPAFERALAGYHFDPKRSQAFRRDFDAESLRLLEESLAKHLQRYGYK